MYRQLGILFVCGALSCSAALGATSNRTAPVDQLQFDSHTRVGYEDVVWVMLAGTWPGVSCGADWAWFNGKDNPQFVATLLAARTTGTPLRVYVDDTLPKINGVACQIFTIFM